MSEETDVRTAALLQLVANADQRNLAAWLLASLDALEQTDFGELEPAGVGAAMPER
jgi:hypothetical protein